MAGELHVTRTEEVPPDPALARYIGLHHSLLSAVADIVDNSLDADARHVLVELQLDGRVPVGLRVIDDGRGMSADTLRNAVVMGRARAYGDGDLGHFGVGLKAASLSQAREVVILSRALGYTPTGRSIRHSEHESGNPIVTTYSTRDVTEHLDSARPGFPLDHGTIIEWKQPTRFLRDPDPDAQAQWFDDTTADLGLGLGTRFHRRIERGDAKIEIGSRDVRTGLTGLPNMVEAVDPFGYSHSGHSGYPKRFTGTIDGASFSFAAHIWPNDERSSAGFRLTRKGDERGQGLFIYRNDRILQLGGWNRLHAASEDLRFARVALDLAGVVTAHASINPEKSGVELDSALIEAIQGAHSDDGTGFNGFLHAAQGADKESHRRLARPVEVLPALGIPVPAMDSIRQDARVADDEEPITVMWRRLHDGEFFRIEFENRRLLLNVRFHPALTGREFASGTSAPLVRTMMYLLTADFFDGAFIGRWEHKKLKVLQEALWQAAIAEEQAAVQRDESGGAR